MTTPARLSALDAGFLHMESPSLPMHTGALAILDGEPLRDGTGAVRIDEIRTALESRLVGVPTLRQKVAWPLGPLGRPCWVDDPDFEVSRHVRLATLPSPGDETALFRLVAEVQMQGLDRNHPLWDLLFVDGLPEGRLAIVERLHHAMVDGLSGVHVAAVLFDADAGADLAPVGPTPPPAPERPSAVALATEAAIDVLGAAWRAASLGLRVPAGARPLLAGARHVLAPASSLNRHVGNTRRYEVVRGSLDDARAIRRSLGGTVNDAVLAAVTGGIRILLLSRGEELPAPGVHVLVPVSVRGVAGGDHLGNQVAAMVVALPVSVADPVERHRAVIAATKRGKEERHAEGTRLLLDLAEVLPEPAAHAVSRLVHRQPFVNLVATNVPGSSVPLHLGGARLREAFPIVPLAGNLDVSVGILSYDGQLNLGLLADPEACPDLDVLVAGIKASFTELLDRIRAAMPAPPSETAPTSERPRPPEVSVP